MRELWLLCEGDSDVPVLASVLGTVLNAEIIPKPAGGSSTAASAAAYVARHHGVAAAYVVDRDYRRRTVADATYTDGRTAFMWRRHAIESYLLAPEVIAEAFRRLKASMVSVRGPSSQWVRALPEDTAAISEGLRVCATTLAPREATRMAIERLWEDLSESAGRIQKRVPPSPGGGTSPDATACRRAYLDEGARLVAKAGEARESPHLTPASLGARYDEILTSLTEPAYLAELKFIEDFRGRDLLEAFRLWLAQEHKSKLSYRRFVIELEAAVPTAYRANRQIYGSDDFLDLANGVRALAGLAPL